VQLNLPDDARDASADGHCVQFYGSETAALVRDVAAFIAGGIERGNSAVIVATPDRRDALFAALSETCDASVAIETGALAMIDAAQAMDRFLVRGYPDSQRFDDSIGEEISNASKRNRGGRVCAFGEMVGMLWQDAQYPAAIRLEQLWNGLRRRVPLTLCCAYPIDVFGSGFESSAVDALLRAHARLLSTQPGGSLESAVTRAIGDVLGLSREAFDPGVNRSKGCGAWAVLPPGEAMILWLRSAHPQRADEVLARAQTYYRAG
jgi:hypothetical protein